jgi:Flp pilus assembly secretin CpaC
MADIPILGMLFRHKSKHESQREVIFFMTPEVVKDVEANTKDTPQTPMMQEWLKGFNPKDVLVVPNPKDQWSLENPGRMGWPEPKEGQQPAPKQGTVPEAPAAPKEANTNFVPARPATP